MERDDSMLRSPTKVGLVEAMHACETGTRRVRMRNDKSTGVCTVAFGVRMMALHE